VSLSVYAIAGTALLALILGAFGYGTVRGHRIAQEACEAQSAATLAASLSKWQETRQAQDLADSAAHAADAERQKAASDQLQAIADKFSGIKLTVLKNPPAAKCELSAPWVAAYNGAP
jgi:hypothetical protein